MRAIVGLLLPALALVLLAAHLLHAGWVTLTVGSLLLSGLLWVRRPWAARVLQAVLALAAIEWLLTTISLAQLRMSHDQPYLRLAVILGTVTVFTAVAAAAFEHPVLRRHFRMPVRGLGSNAA